MLTNNVGKGLVIVYVYIWTSYACSALCFQKSQQLNDSDCDLVSRGCNWKQWVRSDLFILQSPVCPHFTPYKTVQLQLPPRSVKEGLFHCFMALSALDNIFLSEFMWEKKHWYWNHSTILFFSLFIILYLEKNSTCIMMCNLSCDLSSRCECVYTAWQETGALLFLLEIFLAFDVFTL